MNDVFTRRGFAKTALLGAASFWVPSLALAQRLPDVRSRLVAVPDSRGLARESGLTFELKLTNHEDAGLELDSAAIYLSGRLHVEGIDTNVRLTSQARAWQSRSRAGYRYGRRLPLPPGEEVTYDTFAVVWPEGIEKHAGREAQLVLRSVINLPQQHRPDEDDPGLGVLGRIAVRAAITLPV